VFGNAGKDLYYYGDKVRQFKDRGSDEQSYAEPSFYVSSMATGSLVLNRCPLYLKDGGQINGGLVVAGGSTLVMSGNVLKGWKGEGLAASDAYVPHFDLPGGTFVSSGASGTFDIGGVGIIDGVTNTGTTTITGGVILVGNIGTDGFTNVGGNAATDDGSGVSSDPVEVA
jgi:hypothetical protein